MWKIWLAIIRALTNHRYNNTAIQARLPTPDELDWLAYYRDSKREGLKNANDTGKLLQGANAALLTAFSAIMAALKITERMPNSLANYPYIILVPAALSIAMTFAILATVPQNSTINPNSPTDIRDHYYATMKNKRFCIWASLVFMVLGIIALIMTVLIA